MNTLLKLLIKYRPVIAYIFFGVCTTGVNVFSYYICYKQFGLPNIQATIVAWVVAVFFAFVTNKLFVFDSKSLSWHILIWELSTFYACRMLTGVFDLVVMYTAVDVLNLNPPLWKAFSDLIAIIFNFIASKFLVFIKK